MVFRGVNGGAVVEDAVFCEMDALLRDGPADLLILVFKHALGVRMKHATVVREGHMDIGTLLVEGFDKGGGDVGHAPGLGAHALGQVSHALRKVGDLGGDDQDGGSVGLGAVARLAG